MECYFVNNLNLPFNDRIRKGELYDKFIDEYFVPADIVCIAGGISEFLDVTASFLIHRCKKYRGVFYVYGGCDMISDMPLDEKFERIKNKFNYLQKVKCKPVRLDGTCVKVQKYVIGGAGGFDKNENISSWDWWTNDKNAIFNDERERLLKVINNEQVPSIALSYYHPEKMGITSNMDIWHYGASSVKEITEADGKLILTNDCHSDNTKFDKRDFLINI